MAVIIGMDPHERSATVEVITEPGEVVTLGKFRGRRVCTVQWLMLC